MRLAAKVKGAQEFLGSLRTLENQNLGPRFDDTHRPVAQRRQAVSEGDEAAGQLQLGIRLGLLPVYGERQVRFGHR